MQEPLRFGLQTARVRLCGFGVGLRTLLVQDYLSWISNTPSTSTGTLRGNDELPTAMRT